MKHLLSAAMVVLVIAAQAQGFLIIDPEFVRPGLPNPAPGRTDLFQMELRSLRAETRIVGEAATTDLDQVFFNPTDVQLQGYYFFPIRPGAVIDRFTMNINGKETPGEILDAAKARQIYEDIVRRAKDPALLEFYNSGLFRVRVFPIQPKSEQRIRLRYTEQLSKENGTVEYTLPLKSPDKAKAGQLKNFYFEATIEATSDIKNIFCPTHTADIKIKSARGAYAVVEQNNFVMDSDLKLYYNSEASKLGLSLLTFKESGEDGYYFASLSPGFGEQLVPAPKDVVFVMDKSGSMSEKSMTQAKNALIYCIGQLNPNDRFEVIPFSTEATSLFGEVRDATMANRKSAEDFIRQIYPVGGTNISEALQLALAARKDSERPCFIVFMTDGKPTIGETSEELLLENIKGKNTSNVRIFTFGLGSELNTNLLDRITDMTRAWRTYVSPEENIEHKVADFFNKVSSPVLTDVKVTVEGIRTSEVYPKILPDMFKGSALTLMGRFRDGGKGKIIIEGKVNGKLERFEYEAQFPDKPSGKEFVADLWAARAVGYLLDQVRLNGQNQEVITEIVRLSKKHGIITPYTSYLILEDEAVSARNGTLRQEDQLLRQRAMPSAGAKKVAPQFAPGAMEDVRALGKQKDGVANVQLSEEVQEYRGAENKSQLKTGTSRMEYSDADGNTQNLSGGIANVQGRAFYLNNNQWVDSKVAQNANNNNKVRRVQFNSKEYFNLAMENTRSNEILSLGRNIRFDLNGEIVEVYE